MTARMYYDADADPRALAGQKIAIIGYGSQGHAHAQNLHDSGYDVTVVEANPKARILAAEAGLKTADIADAVKAADVDHDSRPGHHPEDRVRDLRSSRTCTPASCSCSLTASTSASTASGRAKASTWAWSPPRGPATWFARSSSRAAGCPLSSPSKRMRPARLARACLPMRGASAPPGPASSRPPSRKRPRPISSASRSCSAAASRA